MIRYALRQITPPSARAVDPALVKSHLRHTRNDEDDLLNHYVDAATKQLEDDTNRQLIQATWRLSLDKFPNGSDPIWLPRAPLASVNTVGYWNTSGTTTSLTVATACTVDTFSEPGRMHPVYGTSWPSNTVRNRAVAVDIEYTAGYGTSHTYVPYQAKQAILLLVGHWYENREAIITGTVSGEIARAYQSLVDALRVGDDFDCFGQSAYREYDEDYASRST